MYIMHTYGIFVYICSGFDRIVVEREQKMTYTVIIVL
jgi:hypothetical protein